MNVCYRNVCVRVSSGCGNNNETLSGSFGQHVEVLYRCVAEFCFRDIAVVYLVCTKLTVDDSIM